jgi:energy-coupling factor transporter transmembrane protein EcfT
MAELTPFGFVAGDSLLHRLDARFKILFLIALSLTSVRVHFGGLTVLTLALAGVIFYCRLQLKSAYRELRYFLILLTLVFVARVLSTGCAAAISLGAMTVCVSGVTAATLVCWRLAFVVLAGLCFVATTRPVQIKAAVQWLLKPVPLVPEKKVAAMLGLIMRFIPVILNQARQTAEAQKARGIENRKNPVYRLTRLGFPILRRTFECADNLAVAMEARCFNVNRTDPELSARRRDWISAGALACLCVALLIN